MLATLMILPGLAGAFAPPVAPEDLVETLTGDAEAATGHIHLEINGRWGDTESTDEELFVRWGYGSDLHTEGNVHASGRPGVVTLSDNKDTSVTTTTLSLYEEDGFGTEDRLDLGPSGACANTVTLNYAAGTYTVNGVTHNQGGGWVFIGTSSGESGCNHWGELEFRFVW